jgi:predicted 3-demethylubiquinone-9 3-methyltransferase (glyoxalase superfamily)
MQNIVSCLWFDGNAEEAASFYVSVFKDARLGATTRYGEAGREIHGKPAGSVLTVEFQLNSRDFVALNGGPQFKFNEAVSFQVPCETQDEIDYYWDKLSVDADKGAQQCGWLKDKYGLSWQVVPTILAEMLKDRDREKANRVMAALLTMKKLDIAGLTRAYAGK